MREIPLTQGKVALVSDEDFEWLGEYKWSAHNTGGNTYYATHRFGKSYKAMHRLILAAPIGFNSDHIDGNGLNNQRDNLRICNHSQNGMNSNGHKNHSSKYKGVTWNKALGKWMAQIKKPDGPKHLGLFASELEAAQAYDEAALKYFGEFARVNLN